MVNAIAQFINFFAKTQKKVFKCPWVKKRSHVWKEQITNKQTLLRKKIYCVFCIRAPTWTRCFTQSEKYNVIADERNEMKRKEKLLHLFSKAGICRLHFNWIIFHPLENILQHIIYHCFTFLRTTYVQWDSSPQRNSFSPFFTIFFENNITLPNGWKIEREWETTMSTT